MFNFPGHDSRLHDSDNWEKHSNPPSPVVPRQTLTIRPRDPASFDQPSASSAQAGAKRKVEEVAKEVKGAAQRFVLPEADHTLTISSNEPRPYIRWIASGQKKAEGRVNTDFYNSLKKGETICFHNFKEYVLCRITRLVEYRSFRAMLEDQGLNNLLPFAQTIDEGVRVYQGFRGSERVAQCGALAICVEPISRYLLSEKRVLPCNVTTVEKK